MLFVKRSHEGHARDSHFWLRAILEYPHKNCICHFEGTHKLVASEYQDAFVLHCMYVASTSVIARILTT